MKRIFLLLGLLSLCATLWGQLPPQNSGTHVPIVRSSSREGIKTLRFDLTPKPSNTVSFNDFYYFQDDGRGYAGFASQVWTFEEKESRWSTAYGAFMELGTASGDRSTTLGGTLEGLKKIDNGLYGDLDGVVFWNRGEAGGAVAATIYRDMAFLFPSRAQGRGQNNRSSFVSSGRFIGPNEAWAYGGVRYVNVGGSHLNTATYTLGAKVSFSLDFVKPNTFGVLNLRQTLGPSKYEFEETALGFSVNADVRTSIGVEISNRNRILGIVSVRH